MRRNLGRFSIRLDVARARGLVAEPVFEHLIRTADEATATVALVQR